MSKKVLDLLKLIRDEADIAHSCRSDVHLTNWQVGLRDIINMAGDALKEVNKLKREERKAPAKRPCDKPRPGGGDSGKVRRAITAAGFTCLPHDRIYSENRSDHRRIKVQSAPFIHNAPTHRLVIVKRVLKKEFGDRFLSMELKMPVVKPDSYQPPAFIVRVKKETEK